MLQFDFYESGIGETIIITFPSGGIGIVDACPSTNKTRPDIVDLIQGRKVHFACLTHPHADHGKDLAKVFATANVECFWHTISDIHRFMFCLEQNPTFRSQLSPASLALRKKWAEFLFDLFHTAFVVKNVPSKTLKDDLATLDIDSVNIGFLSPAEKLKDKWAKAYLDRAQADPTKGKVKNLPNPNELSAVLAVQYGENVVLLGSDALVINWNDIIPLYRKRGFSKYSLLKVPHHGGKSSLLFNPRKHQANYLDLAKPPKESSSILFAGDADHPDEAVQQHLESRTQAYAFHAPLVVRDDPLNLSEHPDLKPIAEKQPLVHTIHVDVPSKGPIVITPHKI